MESRDAAYDELALIKRTQKEVLDKAAKEIQMLKDQASKDAAETSRKLQVSRPFGSKGVSSRDADVHKGASVVRVFCGPRSNH